MKIIFYSRILFDKYDLTYAPEYQGQIHITLNNYPHHVNVRNILPFSVFSENNTSLESKQSSSKNGPLLSDCH